MPQKVGEELGVKGLSGGGEDFIAGFTQTSTYFNELGGCGDQ